MKHTFQSILSLVLCLSLSLGLALPALAANENNNEGVVLTAQLDKTQLTVSDQDQTVTMTVDTNKPVTLGSIGAVVTFSQGLVLGEADITNSDERIDFKGYTGIDPDTQEGLISWAAPQANDVTDATNVAVVTYTIPANTPAGTYTVGMEKIELSREYGTIWENAATVSASFTLVNPGETVGYTATLSTTTATPTVGDPVIVSVDVSHESDSVFAAGELTLTYDSSKLAFDLQASTLSKSASITDENGLLTLADYGADKVLGSGVYTLVFNTLVDGGADVTLTRAAFTNMVNAETQDLTEATLPAEALKVTILKKVFDVTLPEGMAGNPTVVDGDDYTFSITDNNYDYSSITATVNGQNVPVIDNGDGTYTVQGVSGDLEISYTRTPKVYNVTIDGETETNGGETATYGVPYTFILKADKEPGLEKGYTYKVKSITIGGHDYTGFGAEDRAVTIPGTAITGDVIIVITKTEYDETQFAVTVEGSGAGDAEDYAEIVDAGADYTLELTLESGYRYVVTATMGGEETPVIEQGEGVYTVEKVSGTLVFHVQKIVYTDGVNVTKYLSMDGMTMYLVKKSTVLAEGKVSTYDGNPMYWSDKYQAYCYLVIAESLSDDDAKAKIGITEGKAESLKYDMDVNLSGVVDAADAQLVYNMYMSRYADFTSNVTMLKFLLADVDGSSHVNVQDAVAIINSILKDDAK